jgi:hypothetical protein
VAATPTTSPDGAAQPIYRGGAPYSCAMVASARPGYGPFGPHLGLGGQGLGGVVPPPAAEEVARAGDGWTTACLLQRGDGSFTSPRAWPGQEGLVCSYCCVRSVTTIAHDKMNINHAYNIAKNI